MGWFQTTYAELTPRRWTRWHRRRGTRQRRCPKTHRLLAEVLLGKASRKDLITGIRKRFLQGKRAAARPLAPAAWAQAPTRRSPSAPRHAGIPSLRQTPQLHDQGRRSAAPSRSAWKTWLARPAIPIPLRLEWAMEADSVKDLARGAVPAKHGGITVTLEIDDRAQPQLTVSRNGKELKNIPPEIKKKDKNIAALAERVVELKRQSSRMRQSLEQAMCRGDSITSAELSGALSATPYSPRC